MNKQKLVIDVKNRVIIHAKAKFRDELNLKDGEEYCMKKGRGRKLIIEFEKKEDK
jgi:hypothetical protein